MKHRLNKDNEHKRSAYDMVKESYIAALVNKDNITLTLDEEPITGVESEVVLGI